jgi:response regulator RpfG family c-di-GMP phosphodiesterase
VREAGPRILCVDDEQRVLDGLCLALRRRFDVTTATSGDEGLKKIKDPGKFAVVVSDMRMPGMDGAKFLSAVRAVAPDTVRLLLTGDTDIRSAITAVTEGQIFRFLTKPCAPDLLTTSLEGAVRQHQLMIAERELLEQTLHGSIKALTDVLSIANPVAFGRATRLKQLAARIAQQLSAPERWAVEVAAMLSQIGYIVLPTATVERVFAGKPLSAPEKQMVEKVPGIAQQIVANIPRLEPVHEILDNYQRPWNGAGLAPGDTIRGERIPLGARILKVALDYDVLEDSGKSVDDVLRTLEGRPGLYDPSVLNALIKAPLSALDGATRSVRLAELRSGMIVAEDVKTATGTLLVARGNEVTQSTLQRLFNFASSVGIREPMLVLAGGPEPLD